MLVLSPLNGEKQTFFWNKSRQTNSEKIRLAVQKKMELREKHECSQPVEVRFHDLRCEVEVAVKDPGVPSFLKAATGLANALACNVFGKTKKEKKVILDNVSGVLKPGTSTLVIGPKGAGISTLFKALSGTFEKGNLLSGEISYSGKSRSDVDPRHFATYVDQNDLHIPTLTVKETLEFAADCLGKSEKQDLYSVVTDSTDQMISDNLDSTMNRFGLSNCQETIIGNEVLRGISGGERRRVSTAEMMSGNKPLMFFDQLSTGLDSATAFNIIQDLTNSARNQKLTYVFSLLQPSPEIFSLFDDIIIIAEGLMLFQGKPEDVLPFFKSIGYFCPPRIDVTDFIQQVTTDLRFNFRETDKSEIPRSNRQIALAYLESEYKIETRCPEDKFANQIELYNPGNIFNNDILTDFNLLFKRQFRLYYRNKAFVRIKLAQSITIGILLGTVFYDLDPDLSILANVQQRYSIMFFVAMQMMMSGVAFVPNVLVSRAVFYKQSNCFFYRISTYTIASVLVTLPLQLLETVLMTGITFWLSAVIPHDHDGVYSSFFEILVFVFMMNAVIASFFQFIGNISPTVEVGLSITGVLIAVMGLFSGFIITVDNIPSWFIWIYWIDPLAHTIKALMLIVFKSKGFDEIESGLAFKLLSFPDDSGILGQAAAFLVSCFFLNLILNYFALSCFRYESVKNNQHLDKETRPQSAEVGKLLAATKFTPVSLIFINLGYKLPQKNADDLVLLNDVSGFALPGTMTALMGPSGAGKTTLLDVISGRKTQGCISGEIYLNGVKQRRSFAHIMGYVEQMDIHSPFQTVEEAIYFSVSLRQNLSKSDGSIRDFVETILQTLELGNIRNFLVGNKEIGGLTNDEAKRLTIGVELAANPSILFLDEPTTGLDSRAAQVIMRSLKRVAQSGRTILSTIHQPNRSVFELFDRILVLQNGGTSVYFGDVGTDSQILIDYLESIPGATRILNEQTNPAEYMLHVFDASTLPQKHSRIQIDFAEQYNKSLLKVQNDERVDGIFKASNESLENHQQSGFPSTFFTQQVILLKRAFLTCWRNTSYTFVRQLALTAFAVLFGATFYGVADTSADFTQTSVLSIMGVFLNSVMFMGGVAGTFGLAAVIHEKAAFSREYKSGFYGVLPYTLAWTVVEIIYLFFGSLTVAGIILCMIGLDLSKEVFFKWWLPFFLSFTGFTFIGHLVMIVLPSLDSATMSINLLGGIAAVFSGFYIAVDDIVPFWSWLSYCFPVTYALNAISSAVFACDCSTDEVLQEICEDPEAFGCTVVEIPGGANITSWDTLQEIYGFDDTRYWDDVLILFSFLVIYRVLALIAYRNLHPKR